MHFYTPIERERGRVRTIFKSYVVVDEGAVVVVVVVADCCPCPFL